MTSSPSTPEEGAREAWRRYETDFNAMTDADIAAVTAHAEAQLEEAEDWLEAVASWGAAERPRAALSSEPRS